jgi:hypothetical protein
MCCTVITALSASSRPRRAGWIRLAASGVDVEPAHVFKSIEQRKQVGRHRRFRVVPQPSESRAPQRRIKRQQLFERVPCRIGQILRQDLEHPFAGARPRGQPDSLEHRRGGDEHALGSQMREHRLHNWFAAIGCPRGVGADLQAGAPVAQAKAAQTQNLLQFQQMLPASLGAMGVFPENFWLYLQLVGDEGEHGRGRRFRRIQRATGLSERAQLDREAKTVACAALGANEC